MELRTTNCHYSPKKFNEFVDVLNDGVRDKIIDMGFGGLLDLKAAQLCRDGATWLMDIFVPDSMKLVIRGGKEICINEFVTHCVFGLPNARANPPLVVDMKEGAQRRNELLEMQYGSVKSNIYYVY